MQMQNKFLRRLKNDNGFLNVKVLKIIEKIAERVQTTSTSNDNSIRAIFPR